jgi:hypothetical protein
MFLARIINLGRKKDVPYAALNRELFAIGSAISVEGRRITIRNRSCQVFGRYIDFWENQMKWLGVDCVKDEREMAYLLHYWLELRLDSDEIERRIPGIEFPESRKKIEEGEASFLNWYWQNLLSRQDKRFGRLIELFASNERTRRLMSFTRLRDFMFSNRIPPKECGAPLPFVRITDNWEFEVHVNSFAIVDDEEDTVPRSVLGKGNADQVFELVLNYLPPSVGMARYEWLEEESSPAA